MSIIDLNSLTFNENDPNATMREFDDVLRDTLINDLSLQVPFTVKTYIPPTVERVNAEWVLAGNSLPVLSGQKIVWQDLLTGDYRGTYLYIRDNLYLIDTVRNKNRNITAEATLSSRIENGLTLLGNIPKHLLCRRSWGVGAAAVGDSQYTDKINVSLQAATDFKAYITFSCYRKINFASTAERVYFHYAIDGTLQEETFSVGAGLFESDMFSDVYSTFKTFWPIPTTFAADARYDIEIGFTTNNAGSSGTLSLFLPGSQKYVMEIISV